MKTIGFCVLLALLFTGCSTIRVIEQYTSENTDFEEFRTYDFVRVDFKNEEEFPLSDRALEVIREEVSEEMNKRGYLRAENPELVINLGVAVDTVQTTRETTVRDAQYIGQRRYRWEAEEVVVGEYRQGTLVIEVVDREENMLIWRSVVRGTLKGKGTIDRERIREGVKKAFASYPLSQS